MISNQLAAIIKRAAQLREESYDKAAATEAQEQLADGRRTVVDFSVFYTRSMREASTLACAEYNEPGLASLIESMLHNMWNQSLEWAGSL